MSRTLSPPSSWLQSSHGGRSRGRRSLLLSLPHWPPCQVDPEGVSQKGVLGTASTGPRLGGRGCAAGSWHLAFQGKAHCLSPGTLAAGPQHMPESATKMVRRGPKLTTPCTRQILLCPKPSPGGRHQAQAYEGPCVSRTGLPSALISTPPPCQALQLKATVCSQVGPPGASASAWGQGGKGQADSAARYLAPR